MFTVTWYPQAVKNEAHAAFLGSLYISVVRIKTERTSSGFSIAGRYLTADSVLRPVKRLNERIVKWIKGREPPDRLNACDKSLSTIFAQST